MERAGGSRDWEKRRAREIGVVGSGGGVGRDVLNREQRVVFP